MKTIALAIAILVASFAGGVANAQEASTSPTWTDVQRACGTEYRDMKANKDRPTWPDFLNECKGRKGFVAKRAGKAEFRLPDVKKD